MKREISLDILCCLFALLFLYTGLNKIFENEVFSQALLKSPLLHPLTPVLSVLIPVGEVVIAVGLFFNRSRRMALYSFFLLMAVFTIYVGFMLYFRSDRPCSCGGIIKYMNWHQHFYFNTAFTMMAIWALWLEKKIRNHKSGSFDQLAYKN